MCHLGNWHNPLDMGAALCHTMGIPNKPHMHKLLATLALIATTALPATATPTQREIINYDEMMVLVPGLEYLGYSRITTVEHCSEIVGTDYTDLITDSDFEQMEQCLIEHT